MIKNASAPTLGAVGVDMRRMFYLVAVALSSTAPMAMAAPVDLSGWKVNTVGAPSNANWVLEVGNNGVKQTVNGSPTVFFNQENSQGKALAGTIEVQTTSDDDFIGFVLGFNDGDFSNPSADYLIIDWKQSTQAFGSWGTALVGLSISRVSGVLADDSGVDKTWGSCGAFSVCDGQPTIENCGPCDGYSVSPFGRPPHPSALSHAGIGNVID